MWGSYRLPVSRFANVDVSSINFGLNFESGSGEKLRKSIKSPGNASFNKMALCLGPTGSGKTLLLKKLQSKASVDDTSTSVATVGTNIFTVKFSRDDLDREVAIREVGGVMAPLWSKYFGAAKKILYVVDTSNLCQISAAGVLLYTILLDPKLKNAQFLLVLTKMDVSYRQMRNEALLMLQMARLRKEIAQKITIVEASAITGDGREEIIDWLIK